MIGKEETTLAKPSHAAGDLETDLLDRVKAFEEVWEKGPAPPIEGVAANAESA